MIESPATDQMHPPVPLKGYRQLSDTELALMERWNAIGEQCQTLIQELQAVEGIDQRSLALAKTNLQQGLMWGVRSIAQPDKF